MSDLAGEQGASHPRTLFARVAPMGVERAGKDRNHVRKAVVIIASAGRPELLASAVDGLLRQTHVPTVIVSVPSDASLPSAGLPPTVLVTYANGAAAQRNAGLDLASSDDIVFFFDDDSVVREDYVERGLRVFASYPDVVGITGRVLLDGASNTEIPSGLAVEVLAKSMKDRPSGEITVPWRELYGCNFAFDRRLAPSDFFDARLPLYSWLEDHDFARRLMRRGRLAKANDCVIVHRGVKSGGRMAHVRLGYSQMINPLYFVQKGSFSVWLALKEIIFRCGKNLILSVAGAESDWRRQRLRGNLLALRDAMRGRLEPETMLKYN